MGEDVAPFLNTSRVLDKPQFQALEKALHLLIPEITGIDVGVNNRGEVEVYLMQGEMPLPASVLSEGTWRMLGLLALGGAKDSPALLGFEEPENGINPQRLDLTASLLTNLTYEDTQVIVTTHSPTLLDALPLEALFLVRQANGKTSIDPLTHFDKTTHPSSPLRPLSQIA
ncbi:MAG: AAA family ATPase [Ktedonobacteraceae bacterium]